MQSATLAHPKKLLRQPKALCVAIEKAQILRTAKRAQVQIHLSTHPARPTAPAQNKAHESARRAHAPTKVLFKENKRNRAKLVKLIESKGNPCRSDPTQSAHVSARKCTKACLGNPCPFGTCWALPAPFRPDQISRTQPFPLSPGQAAQAFPRAPGSPWLSPTDGHADARRGRTKAR